MCCGSNEFYPMPSVNSMAWMVSEKDLLHIINMMSGRETRKGAPMTIHQIPNTVKLESFWMPFTANRQFKAEPRLFASASGMHYTTIDGRKVIDGSAGLGCVQAAPDRRER